MARSEGRHYSIKDHFGGGHVAGDRGIEHGLHYFYGALREFLPQGGAFAAWSARGVAGVAGAELSPEGSLQFDARCPVGWLGGWGGVGRFHGEAGGSQIRRGTLLLAPVLADVRLDLDRHLRVQSGHRVDHHRLREFADLVGQFGWRFDDHLVVDGGNDRGTRR